MVAAAGAASTGRSAFSAEGIGALRVPDHRVLADAAKDEEDMDENDSEEGDEDDGTLSKSKQESDGGKEKKGWFDRDAAVAQAISAHRGWQAKMEADLQKALELMDKELQGIKTENLQEEVGNELLLMQNRRY
eukprot:3952317-Amphidinium_carterae.1